MSAIHRTVLYNVEGGDIAFRCERWFVASPDMVQETITHLALVWEKDGEQNAVLLSPERALAVADVLAEFGMQYEREAAPDVSFDGFAGSEDLFT